MDSSKRKRRGGHRDDDRRRPARARPAEDDPKVTDDEVEEFFSILRRMRDATRSIATATAALARADSRPTLPPAEGPRWNPTFVLEDFMGPDAAAEVDGARGDREGSAERVSEEALAAPRRLDLNEDPEQEGMAGTSPRRETTARCVRAPG